ncbi:hypothetical protein ONS95_009296 [Cadophora gregata]|uniref:uncharacterized protein n=1 Tax=Cadophora gregata TaxID=51156 RepID=UPI0026DB937E|nr:uncharacterized protein ONS95_009296 [Cadophora gregata]KAK0124326.1 hypothetical protein ONS95_009296 [Cadophora gregata]KAK0129821.1 hypothetical protein ONS96_000370 [Cadophora gregata f. sp. sojae]
MSTHPRAVGLLLRLNAKSFEPINALRSKFPAARHPKQKDDPQRPLFPVISLFHTLPGTNLPNLQAKVSKLAAVRKPWTIKVGAPVIFPSRQHELYGFGFQLPAEEILQLRRDLYEELSEEIKAVDPEGVSKKFAFRTKTTAWLSIRHSNSGVPKEKALEVLRQLEREYPNGFGNIVAEGFALQEHATPGRMRISEELMKGDFPFGAK